VINKIWLKTTRSTEDEFKFWQKQS